MDFFAANGIAVAAATAAAFNVVKRNIVCEKRNPYHNQMNTWKRPSYIYAQARESRAEKR